ncbi:hypothetical protein ACLOJK_014725 [Asimina triloba]
MALLTRLFPFDSPLLSPLAVVASIMRTTPSSSSLKPTDGDYLVRSSKSSIMMRQAHPRSIEAASRCRSQQPPEATNLAVEFDEPNFFIVVIGKAWIGRSRPSIASVVRRCDASSLREPDTTAGPQPLPSTQRSQTTIIACIVHPRPFACINRPSACTAYYLL